MQAMEVGGGCESWAASINPRGYGSTSIGCGAVLATLVASPVRRRLGKEGAGTCREARTTLIEEEYPALWLRARE